MWLKLSARVNVTLDDCNCSNDNVEAMYQGKNLLGTILMTSNYYPDGNLLSVYPDNVDICFCHNSQSIVSVF